MKVRTIRGALATKSVWHHITMLLAQGSGRIGSKKSAADSLGGKHRQGEGL
ncbi:MAG TPA: hypothetical protein VF941_01375 [Clostridia bacterium]